jgi:hypothetical protein
VNTSENPTWQPITALPLIAAMIDDGLKNAEDHLRTLEESRERPHRLDDATVARVIEVFGADAEYHWLFEQQLARWKKDHLTPAQAGEVTRLTAQLEKHRTVVASIPSLAEYLKTRTIESILRKDDIELGIEVLSGKLSKP